MNCVRQYASWPSAAPQRARMSMPTSEDFERHMLKLWTGREVRVV